MQQVRGRGNLQAGGDIFFNLEGVILPELGQEMAHRITADRLDQYVATRARHVKRTTIHQELTSIRAVLRWAVSRRLLSTNPMGAFELPKRDDARIQPPTKAELDAVLARAVPHMKRAMLIAYHTGLRPGREELLRLTWNDVDLIGRTLMVTSADKGGLPVRMVPLNKVIMEHLNQWFDEDQKTGMRYLIHYHGGPVDSLKTAWKAAKKRARVTRRLRMYDIALKHPKVKYEVRYALRPIPKEMPKEKANKLLSVSVFSITRNIAQSGFIKNTQPLNPEYIRRFGADDGTFAVVENMTSGFANGYKNCMLYGIHKDDIGEFYIFHLFDNIEDVKQYIGEIFFSLKFKGASFIGSSTGQEKTSNNVPKPVVIGRAKP